MDEQHHEDQPVDIVILPQEMAGVWANFARVTHSEHEFTIDFVRMEAGENRGIVVSRVAVSPLFITQLIEALTVNWGLYAEKAMPQEVRDDRDD